MLNTHERVWTTTEVMAIVRRITAEMRNGPTLPTLGGILNSDSKPSCRLLRKYCAAAHHQHPLQPVMEYNTV